MTKRPIEIQPIKQTNMKKKSPAVDPDVGESFKMPASYANRFYITLDAIGVRLSFAEKREGLPAAIRCSVFLPHADAKDLSSEGNPP
jgi:hypothetical protein